MADFVAESGVSYGRLSAPRFRGEQAVFVTYVTGCAVPTFDYLMSGRAAPLGATHLRSTHRARLQLQVSVGSVATAAMDMERSGLVPRNGGS
jgi:hypothetical protein